MGRYGEGARLTGTLDAIINGQPDKPLLFWPCHYDCFVLEKPKPITTVFLDTQVFVEASFNFASAPFVALKKHFQSGRLRLLMTDVTINEVKSNITEEVKKEIDLQLPFLKKARFLRSSTHPEAIASVAPLDAAAISQNLLGAFEAFVAAGRPMISNIASIEAGPIFDKYFAGVAPFGGSANKKFEFPDAFVLEALGRWAEDREEFVYCISGDELFREGCKKFTGLLPKEKLVDLLDLLADEDEKRAAFVREKVKDRLQKITEMAIDSFEDNHFWVEDEEGEATVTVNQLTLISGPEIISLDSTLGTLQMEFDADYTARLEYRDSATSVYDRETGRLIYAENREEVVTRTKAITVEIEVYLDEENPDEVEIAGVTVASPARGFGIETSRSAAWPFK